MTRPAPPAPTPPPPGPGAPFDPAADDRGATAAATAAADAADAALVRRVLAGDAEAFGALVARHHERCLRIAAHLVGDRTDAEDAVQEALLRAYRTSAATRSASASARG
jgi:RNA polymerase sigma-70 factor (ECF subfamily)